MRGVSPETDAAMPKKQTTAGKKARAAARAGEKYTTALRRQVPPGTATAAVLSGSGTDSAHPAFLQHRSLLDHPPGFRTFRGTDLFERIGGPPAGGRPGWPPYGGGSGGEPTRP